MRPWSVRPGSRALGHSHHRATGHQQQLPMGHATAGAEPCAYRKTGGRYVARRVSARSCRSGNLPLCPDCSKHSGRAELRCTHVLRCHEALRCRARHRNHAGHARLAAPCAPGGCRREPTRAGVHHARDVACAGRESSSSCRAAPPQTAVQRCARRRFLPGMVTAYSWKSPGDSGATVAGSGRRCGVLRLDAPRPNQSPRGCHRPATCGTVANQAPSARAYSYRSRSSKVNVPVGWSF